MGKIKRTKEWVKKKCQFSFAKKTFLKTEGGKIRLRLEKVGKLFALGLGPFAAWYVLHSKDNSSYLGHSPASLYTHGRTRSGHGSEKTVNVPTQNNGSIVGQGRTSHTPTAQRGEPMKLLAKQVIVRDTANLGFGFAVGSNIVGELQSTIDTRNPNQVVRVILPFGASSKDGSVEIPKNAVLMGQVSYPGKGEKVFIGFSQLALPEGRSLKVSAQALDPKDYSSGLTGEIQSQARARALAVTGLSIVQSMGDVMTEKEALGQGFQVTPKANLKNAGISGVAKAAELEASRMQEQTQAQDFVRLESGQVVIVSLTQELNF